MPAGAPQGNQNAVKAKKWTDAIERALKKRSRVDQKEALDSLAEELLKKCDGGDLQALKELGDRLEGKAAQQTILTGDQENPITIQEIRRTIVKPDA